LPRVAEAQNPLRPSSVFSRVVSFFHILKENQRASRTVKYEDLVNVLALVSSHAEQPRL
jgi:hypothetical protein